MLWANPSLHVINVISLVTDVNSESYQLVTSSIEDLTVIDIVMLLLVFLNVLTSTSDKGSFRLVPVKALEMPSIGANKYLNISYSNN